MRKLLLLRGCPGVGKSTFLEQNNLTQYAISPDSIRLMIQSPVQDVYGKLAISQKNDKRVWELVFEMVEERMKRGEFVIIDATHSRNQLIGRYREFCKKYRYRCFVMNFEKDLETILKQNRERDPFKFVPVAAIEKIWHRLQSDKVPGWTTQLTPDEYSKVIEEDVFDFTKEYDNVAVFGDIHGCDQPLEIYEKKYGFPDSTLHIFVGDLFDRGIQNVEVFRRFQDLVQKRNVMLLCGNHDHHIADWINGKEKISAQFLEYTLKQWKEAGITDSEIKQLYYRFGQMAYFRFGPKTYCVTHGGVPNIPTVYTPTMDFIKGVGNYEDIDSVAKAWEMNTPEDHYMIHGHRNTWEDPINPSPRTFNLCDRVEFGHYLRVMHISKKGGHKGIKIKNKIYDKNLYDRNAHRGKSHKALRMADDKYITELNKDTNIIKKDLGDGIFSYNFSREVFGKGKWYDRTITARGLFIDLGQEKIVARSYDKFFNWGQMSTTKTESLQRHLTFPVKAYHKYNGFLGILSRHKGEWFIASKSTNKGDFAGWFKDIITPHLPHLLPYFEGRDITMVFEVIDPVNDPHIVEYPFSSAVLLDVIKNKFEFERDQEVFDSISEFCPLFCQSSVMGAKKLEHEFKSFKDLYLFKKSMDEADGITGELPLDLPESPYQEEGLVFEDATGLMVKYKSPYYSFWKGMRKIVQKLVKEGNTPAVHALLHSGNDFKVFNEILTIDPEELANMSIIDVRNRLIEKGKA